eukprot:487832-Pelagomonas_calceolata.AAC.1
MEAKGLHPHLSAKLRCKLHAHSVKYAHKYITASCGIDNKSNTQNHALEPEGTHGSLSLGASFCFVDVKSVLDAYTVVPFFSIQ